MEKENNEPKIFKKVCPKCGKKFYSLSEKQLEYNYISHLGSCNSNKKFNNVSNKNVKNNFNNKETSKRNLKEVSK